jgi:tetratricopeptide (TPR) repeat protein
LTRSAEVNLASSNKAVSQVITISPPSRLNSVKKRSSRRYAVNRRLLLLTLVILAAILPLTSLWYKHRVRQTSSALLSRAEQLEQQGNWTEATSYYQRYLLLEPENTPALVRMAEAFGKLEPTPNRLSRLNNLLYRALGRAPERDDLRLRLAENLLRLGALEEAQVEAEKLLDKAPEKAQVARKVIAFSLITRARLDDAESIRKAVNSLIAIAAELPADVELVTVTASTLRENPTVVIREDSDPATLADQMMDRLVAADPKNVESLLARYRYRVRYKLADADRDLKTALEIAPENIDAILLSASSASTTSSVEEQQSQAETLLRRAIELAPADARAYLALAIILEKSGDRDSALKLLQDGRTATDNNFELGLAFAHFQISAEKLADVEQTLRDLESQSATYMVRLDGAARAQVENRLRLLRARLGLARGNHRASISQLQSILISTEASANNQRPPEWAEATRLLAQFYARSGQWDRASEYWSSLASAFPGDAAVVGAAADAYLKTGNARGAIDRLDDFARRASPTDDLLAQFVQAHLALQLSRPAADRNWTEFERALEAAKPAGDRVELMLSEVSYLLANGDQREAAAALLRTSEQKFADQVLFWRNAARVYQELGQTEDMERALVKHRELDASAIDHATLQAALLASEGKNAEADQLLANLAVSLDPGERRKLERLRVAALAASNNPDGAMQLAKRLIETDPKDNDLLTTGIEVALGTGDFKTAEAWESLLRAATDNGPHARYLRSRRLLLLYSQLPPPQKQELGNLIAELREERPRWYPAIALAARLAQLRGDSRQALADYQLAVDLGDRRPVTFQQVIAMLYEYGRFDEAQAYLSRLTLDQPAAPFFDAIAVELAVKQDRMETAIQLAKQSVDRFPNDAMRRVYWANLLLRFGQPPEAVKVLQEAAHKFSNDSRVWTALFTAFVQAGQVEEAQKTLAAMVTNSTLPKERRHFMAAQGYDILGETAEAKKQYQLAIEQQPQETGIRLKFAKLLSNSDPSAARDQFEGVLRQDPVNDEARRGLAIILAASGQEADWTRATQLLASADGKSPGDASTSDRLRAMLLSRKGRTRAERIENCQAARNILHRLIEIDAAEANDLNRLLMAQIFEQEAALSEDRSLLFAARDVLRTVIDRGPPTAEKLTLYIDFLLRHANGPASGNAEESTLADANADVTQLKELFLTDAEAKLEDLRRLPASGDQSRQAMSVALTARLLQARERGAEAAEFVADYVTRQSAESDDKNNSAQRSLSIGKLYTSIGDHAKAEPWYRLVMESNPSAYVLVVQSLVGQGKRREAAELCLSVSGDKPTPEVAAVLANLMTVTDEPVEELPAARAAIEAAGKDHADHIDLLQSQAVWRASRGQYDDAIALFRRVVELDPNNALALNNLATLLAEKPNQRTEALEHVQRAIDVAGRQPALLDTQGTILFKIGDAKQAISCLEEATAGGAVDARYYLHLAAAYHQARRDEDALRMLKESRAFGLEKFVLTDDDRKLLAALDEQVDALPTAEGTP